MLYQERPELHDLLQGTIEGVNSTAVIENAAQKAGLVFDPAMLGVLDGLQEQGVEKNVYSQETQYSIPDQFNPLLRISNDDIHGESVMPVMVEQGTTWISPSRYGSSSYRLWRTGVPRHDRLDQRVGVGELPYDASPIRVAQINRDVLPSHPETTYGEVRFHHTPSGLLADKFGRQAGSNPIFLTFRPEVVYVTTYGPDVLGEISYAQLASEGIIAAFEDGPESAELQLRAFDLSINLKLGKQVKENYPLLLFTKPQQDITNNIIHVQDFSKDPRY